MILQPNMAHRFGFLSVMMLLALSFHSLSQPQPAPPAVAIEHPAQRFVFSPEVARDFADYWSSCAFGDAEDAVANHPWALRWTLRLMSHSKRSEDLWYAVGSGDGEFTVTGKAQTKFVTADCAWFAIPGKYRYKEKAAENVELLLSVTTDEKGYRIAAMAL